nr:hypothetical protein [Tanacetum cinerariifolium]
MLDRKDLSLTLDDFKKIFYLPQATKHNHDRFVPPPSFYDMIPFYNNHLGLTMELKTPSSFKTTGLLQPEIQRQSWNEDSRLDDLRRDEANGALSDVCGEHVVDDSSIPRNDEHNILGTRLKPMSDKESLEVEITDVIVPMNVYDEEEEEEEIFDEVYELKRREKEKNVEESRIIPSPTPISSHRIHTDLVSSDTKKLQELT